MAYAYMWLYRMLYTLSHAQLHMQYKFSVQIDQTYHTASPAVIRVYIYTNIYHTNYVTATFIKHIRAHKVSCIKAIVKRRCVNVRT